MRSALGLSLLILVAACPRPTPDNGETDAGPGTTSSSNAAASASGGSSSGAVSQSVSTSGTSSRGSSGPTASSSAAGSSGGGFATRCDPLPAPTGTVVMVQPSQADQLPQLVASAQSGTTLVLQAGTYRMTTSGESARRITFNTPNVTLRGAGTDPSAVIIDGEYLTNEMLFIAADNITVTNLTITHAVDHGIHISPSVAGNDITGAVIHSVRLVDHGEQFLKVNPNGARDAFVDSGTVTCSTFLMTDAGRTHVERNPGGCYTGGIDVHSARDWVVRYNTFRDIYCAGEGLAEHAIHFWVGARDTLVENNTIINCARGVGFGLVESGNTRPYADNPCPAAGGGFVGHFGGTIRNNAMFFEVPWYDTGIELDQACGASVFHNTVLHSAAATGFYSSIDYRFANTSVEIRNNLVGRITVRNGAAGTVDHNLENATPSLLVGAAAGDFHLTASASGAIDQGVTVNGAGVDLDGELHTNGAPDIGADER